MEVVSPGMLLPHAAAELAEDVAAHVDDPPFDLQRARTRRRGLVEIMSAWRSKRCGVTTTLTIPVSSSSERKTKPRAVPGRWRQMTSPAVPTRSPSRPRVSRSRAVRRPLGARAARRWRMGWPLSEIPVMR